MAFRTSAISSFDVVVLTSLLAIKMNALVESERIASVINVVLNEGT